MSSLFDFQETEMCGIRKGIVFYFGNYMDSDTLSAVESIIEQFLLMTHLEFTKKRGGNDYVNIRNLRGGWKKVFHREFDHKDFALSAALTLDSCTPQRLQTIFAYIGISNFRHPQTQLRYQHIYFQLPLETEWSAVCRFIAYVNGKLDLHYAGAGYEMASNIYHYPGSEGKAVRALKNLKYVNSNGTEWAHLFSCTDFGVPCPNLIQVLCPALARKIDSETADGIYRTWENNRLVLDILERTTDTITEPAAEEIEARYQKLYQLLRPILISPPRSMFMRADDWNTRMKRFEENSQ